MLLTLLVGVAAVGKEQDTLPTLTSGKAPDNVQEMWAGFDPRAEPLEVTTLTEWEEDGVVLRVIRFPIGWINFPKPGKYEVSVACLEGNTTTASLRAIRFAPIR